MKQEEIESIANSIKEKIGDENNALISEEIVKIISDNTNMNNIINDKDNEINNLQKIKNDLIETNGKLFQQVSIGKDEKDTNEEDIHKTIEYKTCFDEQGNFIN